MEVLNILINLTLGDCAESLKQKYLKCLNTKKAPKMSGAFNNQEKYDL